MPGYLAQILAHHRARAAADRRDLEALAGAALASPPPRDFVAALARKAVRGNAEQARMGTGEAIAVIAEVKRRSPSKGDLAIDLDPAGLAAAYEAGGATCLSVLTDAAHFAGSAGDLVAARRACNLPVLRKDFTVCEADLYDARLMGADAVLLIVAALSGAELAGLLALATRLSLAALVEVHDEAELERALEAGAGLVGVNQRDLRSFEVDTARAERVRAAMPGSVVSVAESGIRSPGDLARLAGAGFHAALVGETLVTSTDPAAALRQLRGVQPAGSGAGIGAGAPIGTSAGAPVGSSAGVAAGRA